MRGADVAETEPGDLVFLKPVLSDPAVLLEAHGLLHPQPVGLALEHLVVLFEAWRGRGGCGGRIGFVFRRGGSSAEHVTTTLGQTVAVGKDLRDFGYEGELNHIHGVRGLVANVGHDLHDAMLVNPILKLARVQIGECAEGLLHQFLDGHADVRGGAVDRPPKVTPRVGALEPLTARLLA